MEVIKWGGMIIGGLVWFILAFNAVYIFIFALAARILRRPQYPATERYARMVIFVPCYRGDAVILHTLPQNLKVDYPADRFKIVVIADGLQPDTVKKLRRYSVESVEIVEVQFAESTKIKSLQAAARQVPTEAFDYAVVLDIDNVMDKAFLREMNKACQTSKTVIQGQRLALNLNSPMAWLDGISEEINNRIFRAGHYRMGLSAAFIGSGKAMAFDFYKKLIPGISSVGEDKEMEMQLLQDGMRIHYAPAARVYDEKTQAIGNFKNQRRRWLAAQFFFLRKNIAKSFKALLTRGNLDYFDKVIQMTLVPRLLLLGISTFLGLLALWLPFYPPGQLWLANALVVYGAFVLALPRWAFHPYTLRAILALPRTFAVLLTTLFRLNGAHKKFIHTEHSTPNQKSHSHENRD